MCIECENEITSAVKKSGHSKTNFEKLAMSLQESPWNEFIELEKSGQVKIPAGQFKNKLQEINPDVILKTKRCPMNLLRQQVEKG